jgi:hypothetical protein
VAKAEARVASLRHENEEQNPAGKGQCGPRRQKRGPVSRFIAHNYRHFNAAALLDAAKGYETHLQAGGKMLVTLAGAMSTAELGSRWPR